MICADFALFQQLQGSVSSLLQTVAKDEDMSWARREQQALGMVPSTGGGRNCLQTLESWNLTILILTDFYNKAFMFCILYPASSPLPSRSRSSSVGDCLGLGGGRAMRALVSHPSSNPKLLPFNRGELVTVLVQEPRNGWLFGRTGSSHRCVCVKMHVRCHHYFYCWILTNVIFKVYACVIFICMFHISNLNVSD